MCNNGKYGGDWDIDGFASYLERAENIKVGQFRPFQLE